jgi:putative ABC transport system permease protein
MLDTLRRDIVYAIRGLRARPLFALAVIATLALGLGANAAMFGIVDRLLFRPPPGLDNPDRTHRIYLFQTYRGREQATNAIQYARYTDIAASDSTSASASASAFERFAAHSLRRMAVGAGDAAREMRIATVSASFFGFFDASPQLGRWFTHAEDRPPAGQPVAVISHAMWQAQYGGRAAVLGATVQIGPTIYTIVGVAPPAFAGLWPEQPPAAFIPITSYAAGTDFRSRSTTWYDTYGWSWMNMIARRRAGISPEQANAALTAAFTRSLERQRQEQPAMLPTSELRPRALAGSVIADRGPNASSVTRVAAWVGGVSIIVLIIACANVANLLLARALSRRREIALRLALGVSRLRLISQLLTESFLLALLGGAAGVLIAHWGGGVLRASLLQGDAPARLTDPRTVVFALAVAVLIGALTGIPPILQAMRANLTADLKSGVREGTQARSRVRVTLLVMQSALSVLLLVGAGLFVRSLGNVASLHLGYDAAPVLLVETNLRGVMLDSAATMQMRLRLLDAARATPGVASATLQNAVPFYSTRSRSLHVAGIDTVSKLGDFNLNAVSADYFATLGTRILRGRGIEASDSPSSERVVVVSDAMAKVLWPGRDPIGQCLRIGSGGGRDTFDPSTVPCTTVVGIAENIRAQSLSVDPRYYYYLPASQYSPPHGGLFVRAAGDTEKLRESLRRGLQAQMPGASYVTLTPLADIIGSQRRSWQLGATMFVSFGVLALVLAGVGLYSVIAYNVTQRTHEMGVRVALGAQSLQLAQLVVGDGLRVTLVGVAIGCGAALFAGRWAAPLLYEVSPRDPAVFAVVAATLVFVAVAASWLPARRATRVDPNVALRSD